MCGVHLSDRSYATLLIVLNDPSDTPFSVTISYPQRSFDTESASDDTIQQNHDVGFTDPPHVPVELLTAVHHLDKRSVTPMDDTYPVSRCHQDSDYPYDVPDVLCHSLRQVKKPTWWADFETV